jgi:hypothetical protein
MTSLFPSLGAERMDAQAKAGPGKAFLKILLCPIAPPSNCKETAAHAIAIYNVWLMTIFSQLPAGMYCDLDCTYVLI